MTGRTPAGLYGNFTRGCHLGLYFLNIVGGCVIYGIPFEVHCFIGAGFFLNPLALGDDPGYRVFTNGIKRQILFYAEKDLRQSMCHPFSSARCLLFFSWNLCPERFPLTGARNEMQD